MADDDGAPAAPTSTTTRPSLRGPTPPGPDDARLSEKHKMLRGQLYYAFGDELLRERQAAKALLARINAAHDPGERAALLLALLGGADAADPPFIEPPFFVDYGRYTTMGAGSYMNAGACILDGGGVAIGARVLCGPNVSLYTATHPLEGAVRRGCQGPEYALPIVIGDDAWLGGNVVVCPGVTVGAHAVVGAGSVVTRDVEPYTVVAGNPARLVRRLPRPAGDAAAGAGAAAAGGATAAPS